MLEILQEIDFSPLFISMKTGILATLAAFLLGIGAARLVMGLSNRWKWILDGIFTMPLVLPPTVAGFFLLLLFSLKRPFGKFLFETFGVRVVLTWPGCVIAAGVIAFPLMYRNARAAFEQIDINLIYAGRTLGMSEWTIFRRIVIPAAAPGLVSGTVLTFTRALGEYGATTMLAGNILGKTRTISVAIATEVAAGNFQLAGFWVGVIVVFSFLIILIINLVTGRGMKNIKSWKM